MRRGELRLHHLGVLRCSTRVRGGVREPRLVLEQRPGVGGRIGETRLDDVGAKPLEIRDIGLGEIAGLGLAPVTDPRRLAQQPDRQALEARFR